MIVEFVAFMISYCCCFFWTWSWSVPATIFSASLLVGGKLLCSAETFGGIDSWLPSRHWLVSLQYKTLCLCWSLHSTDKPQWQHKLIVCKTCFTNGVLWSCLEETSCPLFRPPIFFQSCQMKVRPKSAQSPLNAWADCGRTVGGLFGRTVLGDSLIFGNYLETSIHDCQPNPSANTCHNTDTSSYNQRCPINTMPTANNLPNNLNSMTCTQLKDPSWSYATCLSAERRQNWLKGWRDLARATKLGLFFCSVRLQLWADCGRTVGGLRADWGRTSLLSGLWADFGRTLGGLWADFHLTRLNFLAKLVGDSFLPAYTQLTCLHLQIPLGGKLHCINCYN
jgi:hypothetical protein